MDGGAWWAAVHGVVKSRTRLSDFTLTCHFHALEKEMATHSSVLAWRIPGNGEPGGLPSMGSHRVGHDWGDLAAAAAIKVRQWECPQLCPVMHFVWPVSEISFGWYIKFHLKCSGLIEISISRNERSKNWFPYEFRCTWGSVTLGSEDLSVLKYNIYNMIVRVQAIVSDSLTVHEPKSVRLLYPWDFPSKDTGVGCHFLLQRM